MGSVSDRDERGAGCVSSYLIRRVVEKDGLALEPVLDGQGDFTKVVSPEHVLVPDNELQSPHCLSEREKDGKFESGILRGIHGVECSFDTRGLLSFMKKRNDYVAKGPNEPTVYRERKEPHGSLWPLLSMARRSLQPQTWTFRLNAGCSSGWGPTGGAIQRVLLIGTTLAAPVTMALLKRAGIPEGVVE